MEAAAAKATPRKDSTEKQPAVEGPSAVRLEILDRLEKAVAQNHDGLLSFHGLTSIRHPFPPLKATATGPNTVRFPGAGKFNALTLTVSSKGPITPIEKNQKSEPSEYGPNVFVANAKVPYEVPDGGHVVFPANTLAGSSSSSAPFDQMLGYQGDLANPNEAADGGATVLADDMYGAADRRLADFADPYVHGGRTVSSIMFGAYVLSAAVARVVATSYGGANGVGDVLANLYGAGAFRVVLANSYGAADRGRVVFADPDGAADKVHGGAVNRGHTHAFADEANDVRTSADKANDL